MVKSERLDGVKDRSAATARRFPRCDWRRLPPGLIGTSLLALAPLGIAAAQTQVAPGTAVLWPGEGVESCSFGGETFPPTADGCVLAVDLGVTGTQKASRMRSGRRETLDVGIAPYPYPEQRLTIRDESRVHLSPANQERAARERARLLPIFDERTEARFRLPLHPPLEDLPAGGRFGSRRVINGEPRSPHTGADYAADQGTRVLAVASGVVHLAEEHFFSGNSVFIDHGDGLVSMYFHMHELFVQPGDTVTRGSVIGTVGSTGRSTGPHLHFGLRWRGARIDPRPLFEDGQLPSVE